MAFTLDPNNKNIVYIDPVTGVYKDLDNTYYLNDGTPINDYDPNTGAYQEQEGGPWYTFQGVELLAYDKTTGNYQDATDGTWYTFAGVPIDSNTKQPAPGAVPVPAKVLTKQSVDNQTPNIVIAGTVVLLFVVLAIIAARHFAKTKK